MMRVTASGFPRSQVRNFGILLYTASLMYRVNWQTNGSKMMEIGGFS
jgi:hypothetical protein